MDKALHIAPSMDIAHPEFRFDSSLVLRDQEVHLWRVNLAAVASSEAQWSAVLSADEQARAARFHFQKDRQYYIAGRSILRQLLAGYVLAHAHQLTFAYSQRGKPSLNGTWAGNGLAFNISHSGDFALLAFARNCEIGVDVEKIRRDFETASLASRFFSVLEQEQLAALPAGQRHDAFFRCWTRKEAYIKATGEGLAHPLSQFDVSITPGCHDALLATRPEASEKKRWNLREIVVNRDYTAALCISGTGWNIVGWSNGRAS